MPMDRRMPCWRLFEDAEGFSSGGPGKSFLVWGQSRGLVGANQVMTAVSPDRRCGSLSGFAWVMSRTLGDISAVRCMDGLITVTAAAGQKAEMVEVVKVETTRVAHRRDARWFLLAVVLGAALSYGFLVLGAGAAQADEGAVTINGLDDAAKGTAGDVADVAGSTGGAASVARATGQDTKPKPKPKPKPEPAPAPEPAPQPAPEPAPEPQVSTAVPKAEAQPAQEPQVSPKAAPQQASEPAPQPVSEPQVLTGSEKVDREPTASASVDQDQADTVVRQPKREGASTTSGLAGAGRDVLSEDAAELLSPSTDDHAGRVSAVVSDVDDRADSTVSDVDDQLDATVFGVGDAVDATVSELADDVDATVSKTGDLAVSAVSDMEDGVGGIDVDVLPSVAPQLSLVEQHLETVTGSLDGTVADAVQIVDADVDLVTDVDLVAGTELEGEPGALLPPFAEGEHRTEIAEAASRADRSNTPTRAAAKPSNAATGSARDADRGSERSASTERSSATAPGVSPQPLTGAADDFPVAPEVNGAFPGSPATGGGPRTLAGGSGGTSGSGGSLSAAYLHTVSGAGTGFLEGLARHASWALPASRTLLPGFAPD
jgi:outer membrane biosynthesis protein TonB